MIGQRVLMLKQRALALKRAADALRYYADLFPNSAARRQYYWAEAEIRRMRVCVLPNIDGKLCHGAQTDYCKRELTRCLECPMLGHKSIK